MSDEEAALNMLELKVTDSKELKVHIFEYIDIYLKIIYTLEKAVDQCDAQPEAGLE